MSDVDLALGADRDISLEDRDLKLCAGVDRITQRCIVGLRLFKGEWFLAEDDGMPYYQQVLVNSPRTSIIEALFRRSILSNDEIETIRSFAMATDRYSRKLTVEFEAVSIEGIVNVDEVFP